MAPRRTASTPGRVRRSSPASRGLDSRSRRCCNCTCGLRVRTQHGHLESGQLDGNRLEGERDLHRFPRGDPDPLDPHAVSDAGCPHVVHAGRQIRHRKPPVAIPDDATSDLADISTMTLLTGTAAAASARSKSSVGWDYTGMGGALAYGRKYGGGPGRAGSGAARGSSKDACQRGSIVPIEPTMMAAVA